MIVTPRRWVKSKALVHGTLPQNLLSTTPNVDRLGLIILDKTGAALLPQEIYTIIKNTFLLLQTQPHVYHVPLHNGAVPRLRCTHSVSRRTRTIWRTWSIWQKAPHTAQGRPHQRVPLENVVNWQRRPIKTGKPARSHRHASRKMNPNLNLKMMNQRMTQR